MLQSRFNTACYCCLCDKTAVRHLFYSAFEIQLVLRRNNNPAGKDVSQPAFHYKIFFSFFYSWSEWISVSYGESNGQDTKVALALTLIQFQALGACPSPSLPCTRSVPNRHRISTYYYGMYPLHWAFLYLLLVASCACPCLCRS